MSHTFDEENPEQAGRAPAPVEGHGQGHPYGYTNPQGYPAGPGAAGGSGYARRAWDAGGPGYGEPPMPPRRSRKRALIATGAVALLAGGALGGLIGSMNHTA